MGRAWDSLNMELPASHTALNECGATPNDVGNGDGTIGKQTEKEDRGNRWEDATWVLSARDRTPLVVDKSKM